MPAKAKEPWRDVPHLDKASDTIYWKGQTFPLSVFYFTHEITSLFLNVLERHTLKLQIPEETASFLLLGQNELLEHAMSGMPIDVLTEWMSAFTAIKYYVFSRAEEERLKAIYRLLMIRKVLHLDELIGKREPFRPTEKETGPGTC